MHQETVDPSGRYKGRNFDPNYRKRPFHELHPDRQPNWSNNHEPRNGASRLQDRIGPSSDNSDGASRNVNGVGRASERHFPPRDLTERPPSTQSFHKTEIFPSEHVISSRQSVGVLVEPAGRSDSRTVETPSLTSQPSSTQAQPAHRDSPALSSVPSGTTLESLDKLRQFKAEVEASRRQRNASELEPSKLAQMAESFLISQQQIQHEPGELVAGDIPEHASSNAREQELKERLTLRHKAQETDSSPSVKRERPKSDESADTTQFKRSRAGNASPERPQAQPGPRIDPRRRIEQPTYPRGRETEAARDSRYDEGVKNEYEVLPDHGDHRSFQRGSGPTKYQSEGTSKYRRSQSPKKKKMSPERPYDRRPTAGERAYPSESMRDSGASDANLRKYVISYPKSYITNISPAGSRMLRPIALDRHLSPNRWLRGRIECPSSRYPMDRPTIEVRVRIDPATLDRMYPGTVPARMATKLLVNHPQRHMRPIAEVLPGRPMTYRIYRLRFGGSL